MADPQFSEALIQAARKRGILDRTQAARLHVLLHAYGIDSPVSARRWLTTSALVPSRISRLLCERLPPDGLAPYGAYVPLVHLADGGMGSVYLAAKPGGDLVVIKTMRGNLAGNTEVVRRFERESRFMMELKHPHIVACLDCGQAANGELYLVLEFVPSGDLKELTTQHQGLFEGLALAMVYQVADALDEAHRHHLVHRDIKPPNVFVSYEGRAKLADFGIARSTSDSRTMLTMQGALVGSPYYMSPEQVIGDMNLDIRCDLYAVGVMLYYCLTGTEPYQGGLQDVLHAHRTAAIPDVRERKPDISARTAAIITRCMQKKREDRFPDPATLRQAALDAIAALETPGAPGLVDAGHTLDATMTADFSAAAKAEFQSLHETTAATVTAAGAATATADMATIALPPPTTDEMAGLPMAKPDGETATQPMPSAPIPAITRDATTLPIHSAPGGHPLAGNSVLDATIAVDPVAWAGGVTAAPCPPADRVIGDHASALDTPWLALIGPGTTSVLLYARTALLMGKLCEPPVELCLRKYPVARFRDDCLRISRQHLRIAASANGAEVRDLGSGNGSICDGKAMAVDQPRALPPGTTTYLTLAGVLDLAITAHPATKNQPIPSITAPAGACGLDTTHACDAVTLLRTGNRPEMAHALVLRRLTLGGPGNGAYLELPGAGSPLEIALIGNRWIWRPTVGHGDWQPLTSGTPLTTGGLTLTARAGGYDLFQ
jgi:serine/threonine-protein kinase